MLSNVVGDSVVAFYREFKNQGLAHDKLPMHHRHLRDRDRRDRAGIRGRQLTSFPYFMAIDTHINKQFVERYRKFVKDPKAVTHHALESSYFQVHLWKQAVEKAKQVAAVPIRDALAGQEYEAPGGKVRIEPANLHTWLTPRIAQWQPDGQGKIIDALPGPSDVAALRGL